MGDEEKAEQQPPRAVLKALHDMYTEDSVSDGPYDALSRENAQLRQELDDLKRRMVQLEGKLASVVDHLSSPPPPATATAPKTGGEGDAEDEKEGDSGLFFLTNKLRGFVSLKKFRFQKDGFDLDLSYITNQIIAMGFPTEGVEAVYRNPMSECQRFFERFHPGHYRVYNLCAEPSRQYDIAKFEGRVANYPFFDHNACPLTLFSLVCNDMQAWLSESPENVAAVHCKAGKGRTGTMICAYLMHCGQQITAESSLSFYGHQRTNNGKGVTIPSQRRFVGYYEKLLAVTSNGDPAPVFLYNVFRLRINTVPKFVWGGGCNVFFVVYRAAGVVCEQVFDSRDHVRVKRVKGGEGCIDFNNLDIFDLSVAGTVKISLFHDGGGDPVEMCHIWMHTSFLELEEGDFVHFTKSQIDSACKDDAHFDDDFSIDLFVEKDDDEPVTDPEVAMDAAALQYTQDQIASYLQTLREREHNGGTENEEWDEDEEDLYAAQEAAHGNSSRRRSVPGPLPDLSPRTGAVSPKTRQSSKFGSAVFGGVVRESDASRVSQMMASNVSSTTIKAGWLFKKGNSRRNWKKRWFKLQIVRSRVGPPPTGAEKEGPMRATPLLAYFEDMFSTDAKGVVPLENATVNEVNDKKYANMLAVTCESSRLLRISRVYSMRLDPSEDNSMRDDWIERMREAVELARTENEALTNVE